MTQPNPTPPGRLPVIPFIVLAVALLLTFAAGAYVSKAADAWDRARFDNAVERTNLAIQRRIETYVNLLHGGAGLFASDASITRKEFRAFVERLELDKRYPGIQGIGVSAHVSAERRDELVQRMRREGMPTFDTFPHNPDRPDLHAVIYLEPLNERNVKAIGYDMFAEPVRRAAMEMARDTGSAATSGKVTLVLEIDPEKQAGFLIYTPIYYLGGVPATVELRRLLLAGFVYAPFRADDLLSEIAGNERYMADIALSIHDGGSISADTLLHRSDRANPAPQHARFVSTTRLQVPGRVWTIAYRTRPEFGVNSSHGLWGFVVAAGSVISFLLFVLSMSQGRAQRHAENVAGELRQSERALRASESRFRRFVESNLIGVSFSHTDGRVLDGNGEYLRIIGRRRNELLAGKVRWDEITPAQWVDADARAVQQLRASGICAPFEKEYQRPDGARVPVLVGVALLEGSETETVAMILDLTERKRAEREIVQAKEVAEAARADAEAASRLKDEFLATVSHELRTPLNAIFGWSQLLAGGRSSGEEMSHGLSIIQRSAKAQSQLIDDLLDVSRIVAGKLRLEVQLVPLAGVIESAIASAQPGADAKGVRITAALDLDPGPVHGDPHRLQQIVWNLLSNAVKFTPRGGEVIISLRRDEPNAAIVVSDTGIGLSPDFLPHIFERFRQADASTTRRYGGLGLGLAIVRHLVELHGGSVEAASGGEGKGATFTVRLPLASVDSSGRTAQSPPATDAAHAPLAGVRVLLVEDDAETRDLMTTTLRRRGAEVLPAASADEAMEMFARQRPDVLVSDIGMPDEDGYTLLMRIRALPAEQGGRVPAIALTALARPEDRRRALNAGYDVHIAKPCDAAELAMTIADLAPVSGGGS